MGRHYDRVPVWRQQLVMYIKVAGNVWTDSNCGLKSWRSYFESLILVDI